MAPAVECPAAVADNFLTTLLVGRKRKEHLAVDPDFEALIVDQGPKTNIAFTVNCDIGKQQLHLKFRHRFELRTVDRVVVASLSDRKKLRLSDFFVRAVSGVSALTEMQEESRKTHNEGGRGNTICNFGCPSVLCKTLQHKTLTKQN